MTTYINRTLICLILFCTLQSCKNTKKESAIPDSPGNLVTANPWFLAGPSVESESKINAIRKTDKVIRVTVNNAPVGEIELNVMITPSGSNDGAPTSLPAASTYVEITYKSSHLIKIQAREGNENGTGCVHGGSHPTADLLPSPNQFITIRIPWTEFKLSGLGGNKVLNTNNLCKFNFVNYNPLAGAILEITSVKIE